MCYLSTRIRVAVFNKKILKNVLVGLYGTRGDPVEIMIRTYRIDPCVLQPISNLFGGFFSIWAKGID